MCLIYRCNAYVLQGSDRCSPMAKAVKSNNKTAVEMLVLKGAEFTTDEVIAYQYLLTDIDLCCQLIKVIEAKNNDLVQRIINAGVSVNDEGSDGLTPMAQAVSSNNMTAMDALVLKGAVCTTDDVITYQH